jgi:hypothetical protein
MTSHGSKGGYGCGICGLCIKTVCSDRFNPSSGGGISGSELYIAFRERQSSSMKDMIIRKEFRKNQPYAI